MSYEAFRLMVQGWASSGYLPEALAYGFVVNALLAGLLIGPVPVSYTHLTLPTKA